jgi:hypothetical protein
VDSLLPAAEQRLLTADRDCTYEFGVHSLLLGVMVGVSLPNSAPPGRCLAFIGKQGKSTTRIPQGRMLPTYVAKRTSPMKNRAG